MTVRVRFAPSPTGALHIGGVRTALFNWLFARHHGGEFLLRIEDTDQSRSTEDSIRVILEGMQWLGLDWDEGPYRQTERLAVYRSHAERLLEEGKAYPCYCTAVELEARRKAALAEGRVPKYDGRCRPPQAEKAPPTSVGAALRFKAPQEGQTVVEDLVRGRVTFDNAQLDDLILVRSDGWPTYNFCVVVDDATMGITHVIRGDDHLNNTPRQVLLYQALGYPIPQFAHLPMILGADKARLSKRHGATAVTAYREMGYLPEALINYLARLGWGYGDQEVFSREDLIEKFSLEGVGKAPAAFNPEKLLSLNSHYLSRMSPSALAERVRPYLVSEGALAADAEAALDAGLLARIAESLRERSRTLVELARSARYFLAEEVAIDPQAAAKHLRPEAAPLFRALLVRLEALEPWQAAEVEKVFLGIIESEGIKLGALAQPVRVAVTGGTVSPGIFEVLELVGKERTLRRLRNALRQMEQS
jgi:glutamyl-tRNA synthetase